MLAYNLYSHFISGRHEQIFPLRQRHTKDIALSIKRMSSSLTGNGKPCNCDQCFVRDFRGFLPVAYPFPSVNAICLDFLCFL